MLFSPSTEKHKIRDQRIFNCPNVVQRQFTFKFGIADMELREFLSDPDTLATDQLFHLGVSNNLLLPPVSADALLHQHLGLFNIDSWQLHSWVIERRNSLNELSVKVHAHGGRVQPVIGDRDVDERRNEFRNLKENFASFCRAGSVSFLTPPGTRSFETYRLATRPRYPRFAKDGSTEAQQLAYYED